MTWEAALLVPELATNDRCNVDTLNVDVVDFLLPGIQDMVNVGIWRTNTCTGEILVEGTSLVNTLAEEDFAVSSLGQTAQLSLTVELWDSIRQSAFPASIDLRWELEHAYPTVDGEAAVTGRMRGPNFTMMLRRTINWQRWGSESFPWAGLWLCAFLPPEGQPGCIGQV